MMKFNIGDTVKYIDDGSFPSLDQKEGTVVGIDTHLKIKYLKVEMNLHKNKKFIASLPYKKFIRIKKADNEERDPFFWRDCF